MTLRCLRSGGRPDARSALHPEPSKTTAAAELEMQGSGLALNAAAPVWFPYPGSSSDATFPDVEPRGTR
ncbi:unnamed protein product [Lota lota]